jgi:hypothetical protein
MPTIVATVLEGLCSKLVATKITFEGQIWSVPPFI